MNNLHVLITGAGSGIGKGIATDLSIAGHDISVTDLKIEAAQAVADQMNCDAYALDVSSDESVEQLFQSLSKPVDVLINCAGLQHVASLEEFPQEKWNTLIDIMLNGTARMCRAVLPAMRERGFGRIVNIGSIHSIIASPYKSAYVAAKHGLLGFSKTIALETADCDVTINTICPSYVKTPLVEQQIANQAKTQGIPEDQVISEIMLKPMPKGAFIEIEEISGTAAFLISSAAKNITGQEIVLDGGWCIR